MHLRKNTVHFHVKNIFQITKKKSLVCIWIGGLCPTTPSLLTVPWHTDWESPTLVKVKTDKGALRLLALLAK